MIMITGIPDSFLDGSAPGFQELDLQRIPFPGLQYYSCVPLTLELYHSGEATDHHFGCYIPGMRGSPSLESEKASGRQK